MKYRIRKMVPQEYPLLEDFLYEAIFQKDGSGLLPRNIIETPGVQVYIKGFGTRKDDHCLCAEVHGKVVGAVWVRNIEGYGSIDDETPEFAISLYKEYRGNGIGAELMRQMLELLRSQGYNKASLAVQKENYALQMYQKAGFHITGENEQEYIMEVLLK